jgi:mRNA interferase RelE/StbE
MASYKVLFKSSAEKDLRPLPHSVVKRIFKQIEALQEEPFPRQSVKLGGVERLYRIRVGDFRVVYGVDTKARQVTVHYIRHRGDVYRKL